MKSIGANSATVLVFVSVFALLACTQKPPESGFATAEPECRGVLCLQPPSNIDSVSPHPAPLGTFMQEKIDAWKSDDTHAAALRRLGPKLGDIPSDSMKLHVEAQPDTLLLNVWCEGGTLSQRHDLLKVAMEVFVETHGFDPLWKQWDKSIADVNLADNLARRIREEITSVRKKSPPDEAAEKVLREKLDAARNQLQESARPCEAHLRLHPPRKHQLPPSSPLRKSFLLASDQRTTVHMRPVRADVFPHLHHFPNLQLAHFPLELRASHEDFLT
jgi:hypothetical protein